MVKRVEAMFKKDGLAATLKAVSDRSDTEFHDRDLYPFIYDMNGTCVAHGARGERLPWRARQAAVGGSRCERAEARRPLRYRELARAAARGNDGARRAARPGNGAPHRSGSGQGRSATNGLQACSDCRCTSLSLRQYLRGECKLTR